MTTHATLDELQALRQPLLEDASPLCTGDKHPLSSLFEDADTHFLENIRQQTLFAAPDRGFSPATREFLNRVFGQNDAAKAERLKTEISLLQEVKHTGKEAIRTSPYQVTEAIFPIRLLNQTVHCLFTGPLKAGPFSPEELQTLAGITGMSEEGLRTQSKDVPTYSGEDVVQLLDLYRTQAATLEAALAYHIRTHRLTEQVVQSERSRSLGTLSSGISNHFNGLLSVILGYASFIDNREELSEEAHGAIQNIMEAAQRGRRLTEELLSFAGSDAEEESICLVHDTLSNVMALLESEKNGKVQFLTEFKAEKATVMALPSDIHQIVFNLLSIAIDGAAGDKTQLEVNTENVTLDDSPDGQPYLKVSVLEKTGSVDSTPSQVRDFVDQQKEMRLSSLYGMARRIDGTAMVRPRDETSSVIEILIPVSEKVAETPSTAASVTHRIMASNIWVVDDDPLFRQMCAQVLEEDGHKIEEFPGGAEMMKAWAARSEDPDLMVFDFSMPEYTGLELREWIQEEDPRIPVVLVSGLAPNQPDIKKGLAMKKTYFLQKPFSYRELSDIASVAMGETLLGD